MILVRRSQSSKARLPILVTPSGMFILSNFTHSSNAFAPIFSTPCGMLIFVISSLYSKTPSAMILIPSGMLTSPDTYGASSKILFSIAIPSSPVMLLSQGVSSNTCAPMSVISVEKIKFVK